MKGSREWYNSISTFMIRLKFDVLGIEIIGPPTSFLAFNGF